MIVNEAAERKAIVRKQMIGAGQPLTRPDVMRHIADNISQFIEPERASGVLRRASRIERGSFSTEPPQPSPSLYQRMTLTPAVSRAMEMAKDIHQNLRDVWASVREAGRQAMAQDPHY